MIKILKVIVLVLIVLWVYGVFYYEPSSKSYVEDPCKSNLSINNCYIISTDNLQTKIEYKPMPEGQVCWRQPDGSWEDCFSNEHFSRINFN